MWKNCSDWVKSMTFGTMLDYTLRNIFRYGAISNSVQEVNGSHFPTWPPVKHVYDISQSHLFSITCLKWIKCFQVDKTLIIKTCYVVTELFLAMCHCWKQNYTQICQTYARWEVHSVQSKNEVSLVRFRSHPYTDRQQYTVRLPCYICSDLCSLFFTSTA